MLCVTMINKKRDYEFEKYQGGVYGRILRGECQRENDVNYNPPK